MSESEEEEWHETTESFDAGKHGKDYEFQIAKFLFKRLVDANFPNFKFTREKKGLGKFDDLAYIYETSQEHKRFCLVQLKHILNSIRKIDYEALATNKNSYFLLSKYFSHYEDSLNVLAADKDFADVELEALIICTNIGFADDLGDIQKQQVKDTGLFRDSGVHYKLQIPHHKKREIFAESYMTHRQKLAREIVLYIMQNKQIDLNCLKRDDHVSLLKTYHVALAKYVIDVPNKKIKQEFLEASVYDEAEVSKFRECLFESFSEFYTKYTNLSSEELMNILKIKLKNSEKLKIQLSEYHLAGSIEGFLKTQHIEVRSSFGDAITYPNDTVSLPTEDHSTDNTDRRIDEFLSFLTFATDENRNEKIIREELNPELFISFNDKMSRWYHEGSFEEYKGSTLRKRKWLTKEKLVSDALESSVRFQGKEIKLKNLIEKKNLVCPETILKFFCSKLTPVGLEPPTLGDTRNYYIPRVLHSQRVVQEDALEKCTQDVFIISGTNHTILKNKLRKLHHEMSNDINTCDINVSRIFFVYKDFSELTFSEFVKKHPLDTSGWKSIHWVELHKNHLLWQNTFGTLTELRKYLSDKPSAITLFKENELTRDELVIVSGEPGIGKSTLLNSISEKHGKLDENLEKPNWIIKIDLKDCGNFLKESEVFDDIKSLVNLFSFKNAEDILSKTVLEYFMKDEERVILLLDGFDELSSEDHQEKIIELLKFLRLQFRFKQIYLTTRPHLVEKLENHLGVVSLSLKEISEEEQVFFLSKFLESNCHQKSEKYSVHQVIENFNKTLHGECKSFLGIPLHTYMFAVVFLQHTTQKGPVSPEYMKITSLFENFLQTKYDIYFQKSGEKVLLSDKRQKLIKNLLDDAHKDFALRYGGLLTPKEAELFDLGNNSFEDDDLLDIGIVYKVRDQFHFSNRTFAEYLVAKRLVEMSLKENKLKKTLVRDILLKTKNHFLLYLFDLKLTEHFPFHSSVLNGDVDRVKNFTRNEINIEDCLGRRLLYYALHYRQSNMTDILIDKGALVNGKDQFSARALFQKMSFYS